MSKFSYDKAQAELQQILDDLENNEISIDQLKQKIDRAKELVNKCRNKLAEIEESLNDSDKDL
ncbi:MAG: exodeoxyribonuclease VII small subunit [Bacteroidetes bacterium]|nr:exodeoxyribonuclease VII small subunit [Bacteroidota bacterium]